MPKLRHRPLIFLVLGLFLLTVTITAVACSDKKDSSASQNTSGQARVVGQTTDAAGAGLKVKVTGVSIPADRKPVVTFKLTDAKDNPLAIEKLDGTPPLPAFTLAKLVEADGLSQYENYFTRAVTGTAYVLNGQSQKPVLGKITQPTTAGGGTVADKGPGEYTYTFPQAIAQDAYAANATHLLGVSATRDSRAYVSNDVFSFVPAGGEPKTTRLISASETCNQCHDPLQAHGGQRREFSLCITCHTPQNVDPETGNTVDMKVLVHKIHNGRNLPSVKEGKPYLIVGYSQSVFNLGEIAWPQDVRNCTTCHQGAPQADNWKTKPNMAACGSCHDNVDFKTGTNHPGGAQTDDTKCKNCHVPEGTEFGPGITGAHTLPTASSQLAGLKAEIVKVSDTGPGQKPIVIFNLKDGKGNSVDPAKLDSLSVTIAHPTTDYAHRTTESIRRIGAAATATAAERPDVPSKAIDAGSGNFSYTFSNPVDPSWTGSLAVGMEGYRSVTIKGPRGKDTAVREAFLNPVTYAAVTDARPVARRRIVKREGCNECHKDIGNPAGLSIHGGSRRNPEYCVFCHNPNFTDEPAAPAQKAMPVEGLQFKYMIHSIHKGEERAVATAFGSRLQVQTKEILYPGDLANCNQCHDKQSYTIPLPAKTLPMLAGPKDQPNNTMPAIKATCFGCHSDAAAAAHFELQTTSSGVETCDICHGRGKEFDVAKAHSRS